MIERTGYDDWARMDETPAHGETAVVRHRLVSDQHGTKRVRSSGHCFRNADGKVSRLRGDMTKTDAPEPMAPRWKQTCSQIIKLLRQASDPSTSRLQSMTLTELIGAFVLDGPLRLHNYCRELNINQYNK